MITDWHRHFESLSAEHKIVLKSTLATPSFGLLLSLYRDEFYQTLQQLDTEREAIEFKHQYELLKLQGDLADGLLHFIQSLNIETS